MDVAEQPPGMGLRRVWNQSPHTCPSLSYLRTRINPSWHTDATSFPFW